MPVIDLGRWRYGDDDDRESVARQVDAALRTSGFLLIIGHGIAPSAIDDARRAAAAAFALPVTTKHRFRQRYGIGSPGWTPPGGEANGYANGEATLPDLKESWTVGPPGPSGQTVTPAGLVTTPNTYPTEVVGFESAIDRYVKAGLGVAAELFALLAAAAEVPPDTFLRHCGSPLYTLNLTWYPPVDGRAEPKEDQYRIGPHCDFGTITVLHREESDPPLQVQVPDGTWHDLPHVDEALVMNVGDMLAYWSGGRWRSNPHRILAPTGDAAQVDRLSLVLFVEADVDAMLAPLGQPNEEPMDSLEFLRQKLEAIDTAFGPASDGPPAEMTVPSAAAKPGPVGDAASARQT